MVSYAPSKLSLKLYDGSWTWLITILFFLMYPYIPIDWSLDDIAIPFPSSIPNKISSIPARVSIRVILTFWALAVIRKIMDAISIISFSFFYDLRFMYGM